MRLRTLIYPQDQAFRDDHDFTVSAQTGSRFRGTTSDFHSYPFSVHGYFEWRNWALARTLCKPGDTILEIGANVGTETVGFRDIVGESGRVVAFEPVPGNIAALSTLIELNGWKNVVIEATALGDTTGQLSFVLPPDKHATGIGYLDAAADPSSGRVLEVACTRLDAIGERIGPAQIIFCDTEGAELMVLRGATGYLEKHRPVVVLEASPKLLRRAGASLAELHGLLVGLGYEMHSIGRFGLSRVDVSTQTHASNWLCLPPARAGEAGRCSRAILSCGVLPCVRGVNPMCG